MGRPRGAKDRRPRMRKGELTRCHECPPEHPGWSRTEIRSKDRVPYCVMHLPENNGNGPADGTACPKCGKDFDFFRWGGTVEKTTVHCYCGFSGRALDFYDAIDIKVLASPIESPELSEPFEVVADD